MKSKEKRVKAVNSPQVNKETTFYVHLLVESRNVQLFLEVEMSIRFPKTHITKRLQAQPCS